MAMLSWLKWVLPGLSMQLGWVDKRSAVLCAAPSEVTPLRLALHLSKLPREAPAPLRVKGPTLAVFDAAMVAAEQRIGPPKPAMLNYEGGSLVEVVAAPLAAALKVDTSVPNAVTVRERNGNNPLCALNSGGFDPSVDRSVAGQQLVALIDQARTRTSDDLEVIQGEASAVWPFIAAAAGKPFEHRMATRALLDVGLDVLHPLIAQTKHHLNIERPQSEDLTIAVPMPGHQSAPSGHAAVSFLIAGLLAPLQPTPLARQRLFISAATIAAHRELAGVHFSSDSQAGMALGLSLASWLTGLAIGRGALSASFDLGAGVLPSFTSLAVATAPTDEWKWLYQRALDEWI